MKIQMMRLLGELIREGNHEVYLGQPREME